MKVEWAGGTRHGKGGGGRLQIQLSGQMVWPRNVSFLEVLLHVVEAFCDNNYLGAMDMSELIYVNDKRWAQNCRY